MRLAFLAFVLCSLTSAFARSHDVGFALMGEAPGVNITSYEATGTKTRFIRVPELTFEDDSIYFKNTECAYLRDIQFFGMKRVVNTKRCVAEFNGEKVSIRLR
jgi:hypothetical protein